MSRFFDLPAELRIKIYMSIIESEPTERPPRVLIREAPERFQIGSLSNRVLSAHDLFHYRGLILSCKDIFDEFEHEWVKVFNTWLLEKRTYCLPYIVLPTMGRTSDSVHLRVGCELVDRDWMRWMRWDRGLSDFLCSIALCIDSFPSFWLSTVEPDESGKLLLDAQEIHHFKVRKSSKDDADARAFISRWSGWFMGEVSWFIPVYLSLGVERSEYVAMNWVWKEVVEYRQHLGKWVGIRWRREIFLVE